MSAVLVPASSEAEWLEARRQGITASEIAVVLGLSPYSSPYKLYHQKLGILPADGDSPAMERGRVLEPYVVGKFAAAHPDFIVDGDGRELFAHPERAWQMATPDRLLFTDQTPPGIEEPFLTLGSAGLLETKTASDMSEWGEPGTGEIPVHYRAQVLWQMDVMGVAAVWVACLDVPRWEVREYVIEHDPYVPLGYDVTHTIDATGGICDLCADILMMRVAALEFLDRIERQDAPDVDWRPATIGALKALHPSVTDEDVFVGSQVARRYRAAARNHKHWEQRKRLYEAQLRQQMGSARRAWSGGEVIARRDVFEQREYVRKATTVDKLVPVYPKEKQS